MRETTHEINETILMYQYFTPKVETVTGNESHLDSHVIIHWVHSMRNLFRDPGTHVNA